MIIDCPELQFHLSKQKASLRYLEENKRILSDNFGDGSNLLHRAVEKNCPLLVYYIMSKNDQKTLQSLSSQRSKAFYDPIFVAASQRRIKILSIMYNFLDEESREHILVLCGNRNFSEDEMQVFRKETSSPKMSIAALEDTVQKALHEKSFYQQLSFFSSRLFKRGGVSSNQVDPLEREALLTKKLQ